MTRIGLLSLSFLFVVVAAGETPPLRKGVRVQMPFTTNAVPVPDADLADSLIVAVTYRSVVFLEVTRLTPAQLSEKLKAEVEGHPGKRVYIKGDERTPYSTIEEVLDALRTAQVNATTLVTDQHDLTDASYVQPKGLEVVLLPPPDAAQFIILRVGSGQASDAELKQQAQRDKPVVLQANGNTPFGEVAHAIDVCRAAGAKVFLATSGK
jgi:biopolymer transport protein ExbD